LNLAAHLAASVRLVKNRSVRAAGTYFASTLINALVPFLLLPVMTRLMDPSDYGRAAMFQSICYIASTLSGFAMRTPLMRFFAISGRAERRDYLASNMAISGLLAAVTVLACLAAIKPISELTGLSVFWVILAALTGVVTTLSQIYLTVLQTDDRALSYSLFQIGITMANIAISLVLMIACSLSWQGRNLGVVLSTVIGAVFAMSVLMWRHDIGRVKREYVLDSLTLGAAGMPHTFANALISYADRFFLSGAYSMSEVGLYSVSSRLAQGYYFLGSSLNLALSPWAFRQLGAMKTEKDVRRLITIAVRLMALMTVAAVLFYLFVVVVIEVILPAKYAGALLFVPWLMGAAYFNTIYFVVVQPIFFYRQVRVLSISGLFICVSGLAMIYGFSALFGPIGVAMGMFGSRFILFAVAAIFGTRLVMQNLPRQPKDEAVN